MGSGCQTRSFYGELVSIALVLETMALHCSPLRVKRSEAHLRHEDPDAPSALSLGWVNGWQRTRDGFELETIHREGSGWVTRHAPASWLFSRRIFEPAVLAPGPYFTTSLRIKIPDLSQLGRLIRPGGLLRPLVRPAASTRHAIHVVDNDGAKVYLPAALLVRELWLWTEAALQALMTPNSLALYLEVLQDPEGMLIQAHGPLAAAQQSDTALRRLSWLAQREDARRSWASVLTFAHGGDINVRLPCASLDAWGWGVDIAGGTLVAELSSVELRFGIPQEDGRMFLGKAERRCPPPPARRSGLISF